MINAKIERTGTSCFKITLTPEQTRIKVPNDSTEEAFDRIVALTRRARYRYDELGLTNTVRGRVGTSPNDGHLYCEFSLGSKPAGQRTSVFTIIENEYDEFETLPKETT